MWARLDVLNKKMQACVWVWVWGVVWCGCVYAPTSAQALNVGVMHGKCVCAFVYLSCSFACDAHEKCERHHVT
jgi:hypothetical protein